MPPLSESESVEVQQLLALASDPGSPALSAYARGKLRAYVARADGEDVARVRAALDGRRDWTPPPTDGYARGAARAVARTHGQEMNR